MTSNKRLGVTLIELLVAIGIILAITAAVIPVMAPVMAGRRLREGSRGVNTFINSARNRAMVTGRPVGVSFERLEAEPQASIVLHMVEVPPAWSGADTRTKMRVNGNGQIIGIGHVEPGALGPIWVRDDYWLTLVRPGDQIELNSRKQRFRLWSGEPFMDFDADGQFDNGSEPYIDSNGNGGYDAAPGSQLTQPKPNDTTKTVYFQLPGPEPVDAFASTLSNNAIWTLSFDDPRRSMSPPNIPPGDYQFKIIRQPVKSASISYQLPVGTVVDLGVSGIDQGSYFAPLNNTDLSPVILLFAPNGSIDRVWCHQGMTAGGPTASTIWGSSRPTSSVQFLVGRREAVGLTVPPGEGPDVIPNWFDLENLWIGVKSQTGAVSTNPNAAVFDSSGNPISQPFQDGDEDDARAVLSQAREFARQGQSMGGN
jgi:type II secretory pathway pseudopilin PulG